MFVAIEALLVSSSKGVSGSFFGICNRLRVAMMIHGIIWQLAEIVVSKMGRETYKGTSIII